MITALEKVHCTADSLKIAYYALRWKVDSVRYLYVIIDSLYTVLIIAY